MPKYIKIIVASLIFIFINLHTLQAAEKQINVYFFYGQGCPHCAKEEKFLAKLEGENKNITIYRYEVWHSQENASLLGKIAKGLNINITGVPVLIVGDKSIIGYYDDNTTGREIKQVLDEFLIKGCDDKVASIVGLSDKNQECQCQENDNECWQKCGCEKGSTASSTSESEIIRLPLLGEVNIKKFSLPLLTIIIAAIDGFNPCALWVLIFLLSMLIGTHSKRKILLLGATFIFASALVYFLFLSAWLNFFLFVAFVRWIRLAIALVALGSGSYYVYDFYKNRDGGCKVTDNEKRKNIFNKLRDIINKESLLLSLFGIALLAFAVNLVEAVCSIGLPAIYTKTLSMSNLARWQYYIYLLLYTFIFVLNQIIIFFAALATMQIKALSHKYTRFISVAGGIVMIIIGILLIFKPEWLMFG
jgi:glutaredoxin